MDELRYTLLSDGPTDKALMPIITWLLRQHLPNLPIQFRWADLRRLPRPPRELADRILTSLELYPCDILFIHRDVENSSLDTRLNEIKKAVGKASADKTLPPAISVVPMRMTEAWLLFDIGSIRHAAGNPNGTVPLNIPNIFDLEKLANPKKELHSLLLTATERRSYRKKRFDTNSAVLQISKFIEDFSPLRNLYAFRAFEEEVIRTIESHCWNGKS